MPQMHFYFDYISPYAYLAWPQVKRIAASHGAELVLRPTLLAGLLNHHGHKGPAEIPAKRLYTYKDIARRAVVRGVVFKTPAAHPFKPLLPLRVSCLEMPESTRVELVDQLYLATWAESRDVTDPRVIAEIAGALGIADAIERANGPEAKAQLRSNTNEAIEKGIFGVPTVAVGAELFWGGDSLSFLDAHLAGADPLLRILDPDWTPPPVGANR